MSGELAVERLVRLVRERFELEGPHVPVLFGAQKVRQKLEPGNRVIWVPGDDETGDLGSFGPARHPGRNPRPLGTLHEIVTVYLVATDTGSLTSEEAQYRAGRLLWDAWYRAVYLAAHGTFEILRARWEIRRKERPFGSAIRVLLAVQSMVPDEPVPEIATGVGAEISPSLADTPDPTIVIPLPETST